jgi:NitT/TauT family transport system ATP-binding protein
MAATEALARIPSGEAAGDAEASAVVCQQVSVRFVTDRRTVTALDNISFSVEAGGFLCVLGPSGCGKSTLLRVVADLIDPSSGTLRVFGRTPRQARIDRALGFVFQDAALLPWRSALENVELPLEVGGRRSLPKGAPTPRELLRLVGLEGWETSFPHELSGGMRQRVAIARALLGGPRLLLMDEPFGALDAMTRDELDIELLRIWHDRKKTVLFVTHSIQEAVFLSDHVIVMSARPGRLLEQISIRLPRPRTMEMMSTTKFGEYTLRIRALLQGVDGIPAVSPGSSA